MRLAITSLILLGGAFDVAAKPGESSSMGLSLAYLPARGECPPFLFVGDRRMPENGSGKGGAVAMLSLAEKGKVERVLRGATAGDGFSSSLCTLVGGEGEPSLLVVGTEEAESSAYEASLSAYSLPTGTLIWSTPTPGIDYMRAHAVGDISGDGFPDVGYAVRGARGPGKGPSLVFIDGRVGRLILRWESSTSLDRLEGWCGVGDVNGDKLADLCLVGSDDKSTLGRLIIQSGADGSVLRSEEWSDAGLQFRMPVWGDLIAKNGKEVAIAYREPGARSGVVPVRVSSPKGEEVSWAVTNDSDPGRAYGSSMIILERTEAEGARLIVGAHDANGGGFKNGAVFCYDASGALLWQARSTREGGHLGMKLCAITDVDRDGIRDLAVSEATPYTLYFKPHVLILSGRTGKLLRTLDAQELGLGVTGR